MMWHKAIGTGGAAGGREVYLVAWAEYRQAFRDITDQERFPYSVTWPVEPV